MLKLIDHALKSDNFHTLTLDLFANLLDLCVFPRRSEIRVLRRKRALYLINSGRVPRNVTLKLLMTLEKCLDVFSGARRFVAVSKYTLILDEALGGIQ